MNAIISNTADLGLTVARIAAATDTPFVRGRTPSPSGLCCRCRMILG